MTTIKLLVAGSRSISDYEFIKASLDIVHSQLQTENYSIELVSGHAVGVDILAERYAHQNNIPVVLFKPEYQGPRDYTAPLKRNVKMAEYADLLVAFWDGKSKGTIHMIKEMQKRGKPVYLLQPNS